MMIRDTQYTLDVNTRTARVLLWAVKIAIPMAVTNLCWNFMELDTVSALVVGGLTYWTIGAVKTTVKNLRYAR